MTWEIQKGKLGKELKKENDVYGTDYIEWEAKEVIDLVSTSKDSGQIQGPFCSSFGQTNSFNVINVFYTLISVISANFDIMDIMNLLYIINVNSPN